jgi:Zn-dependent protease with chaperone function
MLNFLMNFNSRCNEFAADRYAVKLGMGEALGRGLVKISTENLGNMVPDPWYSMYHFSHPSLVERLRELKFKQEPAAAGSAAEAVKAAVGDVVKEVEEPKKDK